MYKGVLVLVVVVVMVFAVVSVVVLLGRDVLVSLHIILFWLIIFIHCLTTAKDGGNIGRVLYCKFALAMLVVVVTK